MWSPERPVFHVGLLEDRLVIARAAPLWQRRATEVETVAFEPQASAQAPAWEPAVAALTAWLAQQPQKRVRLHIVLSARFVRWQLLAWPPQIGRPDEWAAYATLRFRETYGVAVDGWRLAYPDPVPGQAVPASAIDTALIDALQAMGAASGAQIVCLTPYVSAAFDRWRGRLGRGTAWFGVVEPGHISLCLLHRGGWHGLRSVRHTGSSAAGWLAALPPLQAQMGVASGLAFEQEPPLFLAGCTGAPPSRADRDVTWLSPAGDRDAAPALDRMAWGV